MAAVYTISSDESDEDLPSVTVTKGKETRGDPNADQMNHESNCEDNIEWYCQNETDINDDLEIGETAYVRENTIHQWDHESHAIKNIERSPQNEAEMSDGLDVDENEVNNLHEHNNFSNGNDCSSSPDIILKPVENTAECNSTGSQKGKKPSNKAVAKQIKKQKLADEKLAKKAAAELNKIYKPGDCMKYMNIEGDPSLLSRWYMADVPREVSATGAHITQSSSVCHPGLLVWTRTVPRTLGTDGGQVRLTPLREPCNRAVYIADAEELCEMVSAHTLSPHLSQMRQLCDCRLTLIAFNVNEYFKKKGRGSQESVQNGARRNTSNSNRTPMTEIDFQLAVTDLLVTADCDTLIANTASELALAIVQLTKAIAEAPLKLAKRACDEKASFYMRGDNKNCISVDKNGVGVSRLWQQMLAILPQSSLETSRAICAQYKTPLELYEDLQSLPPDQGIAKLADIGVSRAAVDGSKSRRVGPGLARKLHTLFTARNGDQIIE